MHRLYIYHLKVVGMVWCDWVNMVRQVLLAVVTAHLTFPCWWTLAVVLIIVQLQETTHLWWIVHLCLLWQLCHCLSNAPNEGGGGGGGGGGVQGCTLKKKIGGGSWQNDDFQILVGSTFSSHTGFGDWLHKTVGEGVTIPTYPTPRRPWTSAVRFI